MRQLTAFVLTLWLCLSHLGGFSDSAKIPNQANLGQVVTKPKFNDLDLGLILDGVDTVKLERYHGQMAIFGENAFPLLAGLADSGVYDMPLAAGGLYGAGRMIGVARISSPSIFQINFPDDAEGNSGENFNARFYTNLYSWLSANSSTKNIALIGSQYEADYAQFLNSNLGYEVTLLSETDFESPANPPDLSLYNVVVINYNFPLSKVDEILIFVRNGGGLLIAADHWNILESRPEFEDPSFYTHEYAPNLVTSEAGFVVSGEYYQDIRPNNGAPESSNNYTVSLDALKSLHFQQFWPQYEAALVSGDFSNFPTKQQLQTMLIVFSYMPPHIAAEYFKDAYNAAKTFVSTESFHPDFSDGQAIGDDAERVKMLIFHYVSMTILRDEDISVHPAVKFFPNFDPGWPIPRSSSNKNNNFDTNHKNNQVAQLEKEHKCVKNGGKKLKKPTTAAEGEFPGSSIHTVHYRRRWFNTGYYAEAGKRVTVRLNSDTILKNHGVQIGAHTDRWNYEGNSRFDRLPTLYTRKYIENNYVEMVSPYGGLIVIQVPYETYSTFEPGQTPNVTVGGEGAVLAPIFEYGKTSLSEWKNIIRNYPGLWAEFKTDKISYIFPTSEAKKIDNPDDSLSLWTVIMDAYHDFTSTPLYNGEWRRDVIVMDYASYAGAAHAGYPTVVPKEWKENFVNTSQVRDSDESWGLLHEIGHDFQEWSWWAIDGTSETTNNLIVLYIQEALFGHDAAIKMEKQELVPNIEKFLENGRKYDDWKSDPWLSLGTYFQLKVVYGWGAYKSVFATYNSFTSEDLPETGEDQTDLWIVTFSLAVHENLAPFFESWGIPLSASGLSSINHLPESSARMEDLLV